MSEYYTSLDEVNGMELSPLMEQYKSIKSEYRDCILFYRLGDFYEMFYEDAVTVSSELELVLTGKNCGLEKRAAMCGIPFHSYEGYLTRLVDNGHKVAICEQMEDPALAKGIVKRDVIRIVTPGTNLNPESLDEKSNNFILCIIYQNSVFGIAAADVSTGEFFVTESTTSRFAFDEIMRFAPREILYNPDVAMSGLDLEELKQRSDISLGVLTEKQLNSDIDLLLNHFECDNPESLGLADFPTGCMASSYLLCYLFETQKNELSNITKISPYKRGRYMVLDNATRRNLELVLTLREKEKRGSLLWVIDKTKTAMGGRLLRSYLEQPLLNPDEINARFDGVSELKDSMIDREELREYLNSIYDLERLATRISYRNANARDLKAFGSSLKMLPSIKTLIGAFESEGLKKIGDEFDTLSDLYEIIEAAIDDDPPFTLREGNIIKPGFNDEVDSLRNVKSEGKNWLLELETREKEKTGIKNLRIKYSRVFGYCFEVTNSFKDMVPQEWTRKQTLTGAERYTNEELKDLEDKILHAQDRLFVLEYNIFSEIRDVVARNIKRIEATAADIAYIDALASVAYVAERNGYVRPEVCDDGIIDIKGGRHPVVEQFCGHENFVLNDTYLTGNDSRALLITGPNMAGKSTYMRQTAIIVLMAQCGFFVPAVSAHIGVVDRIFTRVGASDDLSTGQSTFMVEMNEVSNILKYATPKSLLILDEIGRGTSTFDGLSIAWAVLEYICSKKTLGAKTMFATHYHELCELEGKINGVINYCVSVKEQGEDIVFLRKIERGGADRSYGIEVARLAGVPKNIIKRAKEIAQLLSDNDINERMDKDLESSKRSRASRKPRLDEGQISFFAPSEDKYADVIKELKEIDITSLTPMECMNVLNRLNLKVKAGGKDK